MVALVDALESIERASSEEIQDEVVILHAEIDDLKKQIERKQHVIALILGLSKKKPVESKNGFEDNQDNGDNLEVKKDNGSPIHFRTSPSRRWKQIHALLTKRGPMSCADIARLIDGSYQVISMDLRKRKDHYFRQLSDARWEVTDVSLPDDLKENGEC